MILVALALSLFANVEEQIYALILHAVFPHKAVIKVWVDDRAKRALLEEIPMVVIVRHAQDADIVFEYHHDVNLTIPAHALLFVGSYPLLLEHTKEAIGGFFWQKGRPNIIFLRKNLQEHNITLPQEFAKYIEDRP